MATDNKFLDFEGLQSYHNKLVDKIKDLKYDPTRMFDSVTDLLNKSNWKTSDGYVYGIQSGLIVTVDKKIWQLTDPDKFKSIINAVGYDASKKTPVDLGWTLIGNTVDFEVNNHIFKVTK